MRYIGPVDRVVRGELEGPPQALGLNLKPDFAKPLRQDLTHAPLGMDPRLEAVEGDLPHYRIEHILDLAGQQQPAPPRVGLGIQDGAEGQHLAENARGFRKGERRAGSKIALRLTRQNLMHTMPQLMGERHHVPCTAMVVHEDIGMRGGHGRVGEGAAGLARPQPGVDPGAVEEALADLRQHRAEGAIG